MSKDRPASGLAGMFGSAASAFGPAPSQLTNEKILDPAGAFSYPRHAAAPTPHDTAPQALQHGVDPGRSQAIQGVEAGGPMPLPSDLTTGHPAAGGNDTGSAANQFIDKGSVDSPKKGS